jgi:endoglucanase
MTPIPKNALPRWRGFNLLEKFSADDSSKSIMFDRRNPPFQETDFQWISDWGFDFVRLPMSYHCWSSPERWLELDETVLAQVDAAVELGQRYGIHVCLNLHRAPGYCVNPPPEPRSLWRDADALAACSHHWRTLAGRYGGISSARLSFDLLNEPPAPGDAMTRAEHERVIRALTGAIREQDPDRLIIADGLSCGNDPVPELADLGIAQSCRAYLPMGISHYKAPWVHGERFPAPQWPGGDHWGEVWDRPRLEAHYGAWAQLMAQGVGVHCGEGGCFCETPHAVFLAWFRDVLEILAGHGIGYALWNFRGAFGVLDSGRADVEYKDWRGHSLDERLLTLLQRH